MTEKSNAKYKDPKLPIAERVQDLLSKMTLEEKVAQLCGIWQRKHEICLDENKKMNLELATKHLKHGIGQFGRPSDTSASEIGAYDGETARAMVELTNDVQKYFVENTRLGIPVVFHEECLHGHMANEGTSYPQPIALAATFNTKLVEKIYRTVAKEARARGGHQALSPVADVARDPRWGRVEETFGEDTCLVTEMAAAAVRGFQGNRDFTSNENVLATMKHFVAHGDPESGNNCAPVNVSERVLREVFLPPFKKCVVEEKVASVMASYNEVDAVPSHANKWLLKDVLRDEWKFDGFVVSDYYAVKELHERPETFNHGLAHNKMEAAVIAAKAGVNIELPDDEYYPQLVDAVKEGKISIEEIDELVRETLVYKFKLGLFENPYCDPDLAEAVVDSPEHRALAKEAALEVITLLKNENSIVPLNKTEKKKIAVIGPNADKELLGGYSGLPKYKSTLLNGIRNKVGDNAEITYAEGCKITVGGCWSHDEVNFPSFEENQKLIEEAVAVAKDADVVVLAVGGNEQTSREAWDINHMGDRTNLDLFGRQNDLINAIKELGKPMIAFVYNGRPLAFANLADKVDALYECWYLGQANGDAIADVLFGDFNPGGKIPMSVPKSVGQLPIYYNYKPSARRGYLEGTTEPLYPFGFGLSYTTFEMSNLSLEKTEIKKDESVKISIDIKNTGNMKGDEVVQLYIRDVVSSVTRPVKELKDFARVTLESGETKTVTFEITPEKLAFWDINMDFVVEPGEFKLMVGNSSRNEDLTSIILTVTE